MAAKPHACDERCVCPEHGTPLIYWPTGDDHACQDVDCEYGHGGCDPGFWDVRLGAASLSNRTTEE